MPGKKCVDISEKLETEKPGEKLSLLSFVLKV